MTYTFNGFGSHRFETSEDKINRKEGYRQKDRNYEFKKETIFSYLDENISLKVDPLLNVKRTNFSGNVGEEGLTYYSVEELVDFNKKVIGPKSNRLNNDLFRWADKDNYVGREMYVRELEKHKKLGDIVNYCSFKLNDE